MRALEDDLHQHVEDDRSEEREKSASGTLRRGLSVSPAVTGTYSKPVQAKSAAKPAELDASSFVSPAGGGRERRCQSTKYRPAATKRRMGISFAALKKSLVSAPGRIPR